VFPDGRDTVEVPRPDEVPAATFSREGRLVDLEAFRPPEDDSRFGDPTVADAVSYNLAGTVPDNRATAQREAEIVRLRGEVARLHDTIDCLTDRHGDRGGGQRGANATPLSGAQCPDCGKIAKNTNALRTHKSRFHRG
jgi:hypothetical protein